MAYHTMESGDDFPELTPEPPEELTPEQIELRHIEYANEQAATAMTLDHEMRIMGNDPAYQDWLEEVK